MERKTNHCVYNINYPIVFCPKYRHKVIQGIVEEVIKSSIEDGSPKIFPEGGERG